MLFIEAFSCSRVPLEFKASRARTYICDIVFFGLMEEVESMNLSISCTTGTRLDVSVSVEETVDGLKRRLSQKLRVPKDRLMLLIRDTRLSCGKLQDFGVADGSRLTLVLTVEAGLMWQSWRSEQSVLKALESLTDEQVSDFLSGRSPLTLALRVADHVMFVQLQLAAQQTVPLVFRGSSGTSRTPTQTSTNEHPQHLPCSSSLRRDLDLLKTPPTPPSTPCSPAPHTHCTHSVHSPAPAAPCPQDEDGAHSSRHRQKPAAFIQSLVNHAPGVFSGTFSGTLHPSCQDGSGRPLRDIGTILQILNDLLSATRHYRGIPVTLTRLRCRTPCPPASTSSSVTSPSPTSQIQPSSPSSPRASSDCLRQTENKTTRCKVQQLQLLLRQRRLRRKARRDPRGPYRWPADRKAARRHSNSSLSSNGSLDLDFEEPVWKPDVQSDMNAEFIAA